MKDNTFKIIKNGNEHIGIISGIQIQKGSVNKYYLYLTIIADTYSIWYSNWFTYDAILNNKNIVEFVINPKELIESNKD